MEKTIVANICIFDCKYNCILFKLFFSAVLLIYNFPLDGELSILLAN